MHTAERPCLETYFNGLRVDLTCEERVWSAAGVDRRRVPANAAMFTYILELQQYAKYVLPNAAVAAVEDELAGLLADDEAHSRDPLRNYIATVRLQLRSREGVVLCATPDVFVWVHPSQASQRWVLPSVTRARAPARAHRNTSLCVCRALAVRDQWSRRI